MAVSPSTPRLPDDRRAPSDEPAPASGAAAQFRASSSFETAGRIGDDAAPVDERGEVTRLLAGGVDVPGAYDRLFPLVYDELRRIARWHLRRERAGHTLSTTALVHEAYLRLAPGGPVGASRAYFFALAARVMRRVLIDYARARHAVKRGSGAQPETLPAEMAELPGGEGELVALAEALDELERGYPRAARVVECRHFAGLSVEETAEALAVSPATVKRDWAYARAWLRRELDAGSP